MEDGSPHAEVQSAERSFAEWLLFRGHRLLITGIALGVIAAVTFLLIELNVLEVGPTSSMPTLLGGIVAGQLTLITVTLSINQLILSRMFAAPLEIRNRLRGTIEFRERVRDVTGESALPVNPQPFLLSIARALSARSEELVESPDPAAPERRAAVEECAESLRRYAMTIERLVEDDRTETLHVVSLMPHEAYVRSSVAVERLCDDDVPLPERTAETLEDVATLLESTSVARQHFKTVAIQQQLAILSRYIVYTGVPPILVAALLALAYTSGGLKVTEPLIRPVVALGTAAFLAPVVLLSAYILPLAIVAERTVSLGPFLSAD